MLTLKQERESHRGFTANQANKFRSWLQFWQLGGHCGDLVTILVTWRQNKSRKVIDCGPIPNRSDKYQQPSRDYYVTSLPIGKGLKASS
ncbi:hypothetical protein AVEN_182185-1 [Araneus ventricosus]|uniref:Uncharacterized protein n=1 Tax=Araneus ventricosus TaxID=182803 RepID=A0A4Y2UWH6_ARAVE|nr:hypothetical protein AVEN_182185-1 [Araneus ventricosus]